ncbi:MAG TPA: hypothetical protein VFV87_10075, partial [Pirellulaceae bacterium]|nr:hypothetical protein [Pirellulaceae bacterium]
MLRLTLLSALSLSLLPIFPAASAQEGVDESPLPVQLVRAFPKLKPRRPVAITHAGDGSNRIFILSAYGQIWVGENSQSLAELKTFLDIEYKVDYE